MRSIFRLCNPYLVWKPTEITMIWTIVSIVLGLIVLIILLRILFGVI